MSDTEDEMEGPRVRVLSNGQVLAFITSFWLRQPRLLSISMGLTLASVAFDLATPWASGRLVDAVSAGRNAPAAAWRAWAVFVAVYVAFSVCRNASFRFWNPLAASNMKSMTDETFARVQRFSSDWHANTFAGSTVRKLSRAMWGYDQVSDAIVLSIGPAVLVLVGLSLLMIARWPVVGLFSLAIVIAYVAINMLLSIHYVRPANLKSVAWDSRIGGALADAVSGSPTVKAFGAEGREEARFGQVTTNWRRFALETWTRFINVWLLQNTILVVLQAGLTALILQRWIAGKANAGDVAFAITAFMLMSGYLRNIGENIRTLQKGLDDVEDAARFAQMTPQVADEISAVSLRADLGQIVFERVTFSYEGAAEPIYSKVSLVIAPGERLALVGPTGSGKSTFVKLIQRLYDIQGGRILIDGQDIAKVDQASLRRAVALVPQDPALFHRSIADNIAYARPDATLDEVILAAKRARAHTFIERLPKGYSTLVGERGVKLSGGERQRVAIARAFLADAPILVLDEATSSLDVETERLVQQAIEALMAGRTTIVIAHRLTTIRHADRILVFDDGRIVEEGAHNQLVAQGGAYARLYRVAEEGL